MTNLLIIMVIVLNSDYESYVKFQNYNSIAGCKVKLANC